MSSARVEMHTPVIAARDGGRVGGGGDACVAKRRPSLTRPPDPTPLLSEEPRRWLGELDVDLNNGGDAAVDRPGSGVCAAPWGVQLRSRDFVNAGSCGVVFAI